MDNGKELEVVKVELAGAIQWAQALVVSNSEEYAATHTRIKAIKAWRERWVGLWARAKKDTYDAWKGVVADEKSGTDICDTAREIAEGKAMVYQKEAQRKAAVEQARLNAIEAEKTRREKERLLKEAGKLKTPELKAARIEEAEQITPPEITVAADLPEVKGMSTRTTFKAVLVSMEDLIASAIPGSVASSLLAFDQKNADAFARSTKGKISIPGVKFVEVEGYSHRT